MREWTHSAATPALTPTPAARSNAGGRLHTRTAQISWNIATDAQNTPDAIDARQCPGMVAKWITATPTEAIAAARAATVLSVATSSLDFIVSMLPTLRYSEQHQLITVGCQFGESAVANRTESRRDSRRT